MIEMVFLTLYTLLKKSLDSELASLTSLIATFTSSVTFIKSSLRLVGRMPLEVIDRSATLLVSFARLLRTTGLLNRLLLLTGGRSRVGVTLDCFSELAARTDTGTGDDVDANKADIAEDGVDVDAGTIVPLFLHAFPSSTWLT